MLHLKVFGFPVTVMPMFWLVTAFLGGVVHVRTSEDLLRVAIWMALCFLSILWHELGHAFFMRKYRATHVDIELYFFGGVARAQNMRVTKWQSVMVSFAGPLFQLVPACLVWLMRHYGLTAEVEQRPMAWMTLELFMWINFGWALVNLLPIYPLDGGQISMTLLGARRERLGLMISIGACIAVIAAALSYGMAFSAIFFGLLAFNNWQKLSGNDEIRWH